MKEEVAREWPICSLSFNEIVGMGPFRPLSMESKDSLVDLPRLEFVLPKMEFRQMLDLALKEKWLYLQKDLICQDIGCLTTTGDSSRSVARVPISTGLKPVMSQCSGLSHTSPSAQSTYHIGESKASPFRRDLPH